MGYPTKMEWKLHASCHHNIPRVSLGATQCRPRQAHLAPIFRRHSGPLHCAKAWVSRGLLNIGSVSNVSIMEVGRPEVRSTGPWPEHRHTQGSEQPNSESMDNGASRSNPSLKRRCSGPNLANGPPHSRHPRKRPARDTRAKVRLQATFYFPRSRQVQPEKLPRCVAMHSSGNVRMTCILRHA